MPVGAFTEDRPHRDPCVQLDTGAHCPLQQSTDVFERMVGPVAWNKPTKVRSAKSELLADSLAGPDLDALTMLSRQRNFLADAAFLALVVRKVEPAAGRKITRYALEPHDAAQAVSIAQREAEDNR